MPNLINRKKQMILFTIILFIFSCQLSLAQEEAQEIKIENKNEFIQEETQLSTENLPKEEVTTLQKLQNKKKPVLLRKNLQKRKKEKQSRVILECKLLKHFLMKKRLKKKETQNG